MYLLLMLWIFLFFYIGKVYCEEKTISSNNINSGTGSSTLINDHIECDVSTLNLTDQQMTFITDALHSPRIQNETLKADAALTHWNISAHQMYRYLSSGGWTGKYNGKSIVDAFIDTVR
jgi:hypothetical protein